MSEDIVDQVDSGAVETADSQVETSSAPDSGSQIESGSQPSAQSSPSTPWEAFKRLPEFQGADDRAIAARLYNAMEREKAASRALAQYQQVTTPIAYTTPITLTPLKTQTHRLC